MKKIILATILALTLASNANASCFCACISEQSRAICTDPFEDRTTLCGNVCP